MSNFFSVQNFDFFLLHKSTRNDPKKIWYVQHFLWFCSEIEIFDLKVPKTTKIVENHVIFKFNYLEN